MLAEATLLGSCLLIGLLFLHSRSKTRNAIDLPEPPAAPPTIPFVGHVIGMMRRKFNYYVDLSQQCPLPIFTIQMLGTKIYVITTPELIQAVQKKPKQLAFPPIEAHFANKMCGSSEEANKIVMANVNGDEGEWGMSVDIYAALRDVLKPGPGLDGMNRVMAQNVTCSLDGLQERTLQGPTTIGLASWLRKAITLATTNANYGPENPFNDNAVFDVFWDFESNLMMLLLGPYPSLLARRGVIARDKVAKAFEPFLQNHIETSSALMKARVDVMTRHKIPLPDIAKYEVGGSVATLVNTSPASFWMLFLVYSHPGLLEDIRHEVDAVTSHNGNAYSIDLTRLKEDCPLLTSSYREMLRYRAVGTSVRKVMEDTALAGQWLLKKDCIVQIPSRVLHNKPELWGADVDTFNPRRFMKSESVKRSNEVSFRAFGGGKTLCPGQHFSTNEILISVALFAARFEMSPVSGDWSLPSVESTNIASVIMNPDTDPEVEVKTRPGFEDVKWTVTLSASDKMFAVVEEDQ